MSTLEELVRPFDERRTGVRFVRDDGSVRRMPYAELAAAAASAAAQLAQLGVREGDAVAIALENREQALAAQLGAWMAGAQLLSIPPPPRGESATYERGFGAAIEASGCRLLIGGERVLALLGGSARPLALDEVDLERDARPPDGALRGAALVQFSSGSTGAPKGIVLGADAIAGHIGAIARALEVDPASDRAVSWLPLYHDMGFVGAWLSALAARAELTLMTPRRFVRQPHAWLEACAAERATITVAPDFAYRLAARALGVRGLPGSLDALRICLCGAEPVSWETLEGFHRAAAPHGFAWEALMPVYGLAEATLAVSAPPLGRGPLRDAAGAVGLGGPLPGVDLRFRDFGGGDATLDVRGPWMLSGYLTAAGIADPRDGDGWFATNDVAHERDGELFVRGRADEAIVVRGRNVFAEDVESVAMAAAANEPVAVAAFRAPDASDRFALAVELVGADDARAVARRLQAAVATGLEATVSPVLVLEPRSIPRTTSGKVRRGACRSLLETDAWPDGRTVAVVA